MVKQPDPTRRSERSRQAILTAARELVAETGYAKLSIEAIAARAGVGKQTIYRWWPSKGAVVLDAVLALSRSGPEQSMALPDTGDLAADLRTVMRATVAEFADPAFEKPIRALNREIIDDPDLAARYRETLADPVDEAKKARLRSAQRAGQLAADVDLDLALELLYAPLYQRWLLRTGPLTPDYADALVDAFLKAMRPDAG
ncbi:transcriptional regulator, TetR family [Nocardia farcinica]|uniref:Mycofactocin system transcriptional regulator n=1 Tax=Nocardia farcinica TaxID=37329 RepID=A0A0H5NLP7_NOCFR|nr:TetR/AcrR family transcriptional regulator [Nocardia farcinica]AXK85064.1 TetR/AcrR family transcriptional regulator [Nocardia farcinica]MBF6290337.1 TetR/AcrR family transcriptional regulator [Nocardia farcinica]MBF6377510.1 TetR/AcrR family transcriptional regulator [Nocardia farcinica]CRY76139.1 mycofactocin system transcriptional regulator [Nocardia farcinica]SIS74244.1 transcriptional regulator, TetR family [Nocardia farcinica]